MKGIDGTDEERRRRRSRTYPLLRLGREVKEESCLRAGTDTIVVMVVVFEGGVALILVVVTCGRRGGRERRDGLGARHLGLGGRGYSQDGYATLKKRSVLPPGEGG